MTMIPSTTASTFSVKELNTHVKRLLEEGIGQIWLIGEISNFINHSSGHWYFSLKDDSAQVRCAMFRGSNLKVKSIPQNGQAVLVNASVTLYEARGEYQLIVNELKLTGEGLLQQKFEQLKKKLQAEKLFEPIYKKPLPEIIKTVGVITSPTGAALKDICQILKRRDPSLEIIIYPTLVQGASASEQIAKMIRIANHRQETDVLIVGRGGGSLEDLWAFNEEIVARAIFNSDIPIISAVGHEIDFTISDFVADIRAATPSAAAEIVSRSQIEQSKNLDDKRNRLFMAMDFFITKKGNLFASLLHQFERNHPSNQLTVQKHHLQTLQQQLETTLSLIIYRVKDKLEHVNTKLYLQHPKMKVSEQQNRLTSLSHQLEKQIQESLTHQKSRLEHSQNGLFEQNPTQVIINQQINIKYLFEKLLTQPKTLIAEKSSQLNSTQEQLNDKVLKRINEQQHTYRLIASKLHSVSPLATLERGYSITLTRDKKAIQSVNDIQVNDVITTKLKHGEIHSKVIDVTQKSKN